MAVTVGVPMCQAMMQYDQGNYNRAVELLYPLRYRMVDIGGSDAQVKSPEMAVMGKMKLNQVQTKLQFSYVQLKYAQPRGFTFFGYLWSHLVVFSCVKHKSLLL